MPDEREERFPEIRVLVPFRGELGEVLIETSGFMISCAIPARKEFETREAIAATDLHLEPFQDRDVS